MRSHFALLILFACLVSIVFAALTRDGGREQLRFGGLMFAGFVGSALVAGWLMYAFSP
ncbi:MAG: hypothetical protein IT176_12670 [Acidobacteria bacterium]|nr:hypothetical protein [Acidobacteriota bacterium]